MNIDIPHIARQSQAFEEEQETRSPRAMQALVVASVVFWGAALIWWFH